MNKTLLLSFLTLAAGSAALAAPLPAGYQSLVQNMVRFGNTDQFADALREYYEQGLDDRDRYPVDAAANFVRCQQIAGALIAKDPRLANRKLPTVKGVVTVSAIGSTCQSGADRLLAQTSSAPDADLTKAVLSQVGDRLPYQGSDENRNVVLAAVRPDHDLDINNLTTFLDAAVFAEVSVRMVPDVGRQIYQKDLQDRGSVNDALAQTGQVIGELNSRFTAYGKANAQSQQQQAVQDQDALIRRLLDAYQLASQAFAAGQKAEAAKKYPDASNLYIRAANALGMETPPLPDTPGELLKLGITRGVTLNGKPASFTQLVNVVYAVTGGAARARASLDQRLRASDAAKDALALKALKGDRLALFKAQNFPSGLQANTYNGGIFSDVKKTILGMQRSGVWYYFWSGTNNGLDYACAVNYYFTGDRLTRTTVAARPDIAEVQTYCANRSGSR